MQPLTDKQKAVLKFIRVYIRENGMAPTMLEIASGMGWSSPNSAQLHVNALRRKGCLTVRRGANRGLVLTEIATIEIPDVNDGKYWFEGVFQHLKYERDVYKAVEIAGLRGDKKSWGEVEKNG
ncbi:LexA family transcriptional regulator [Pantoea cypripedii]|uniref:LexA family transcriptional regulator n=1 Tax=Pantoea cypripedii TaxID=55209 RepID=A0A6B9G2S4_PANCY|nr:LexA family transcriptional regulator [Pantoea cypripedii]QGY29040.1 LexA family transcriptional regulator [Pantoea cypripedii]